MNLRLPANEIVGLLDGFGFGFFYLASSADDFRLINYVTQYATASFSFMKFNTSSYLTIAILPVYVAHQPIMIAIIFFLFPPMIVLYSEVAFIVLGTTILSLSVYVVLIRRWKVMRFAFGLK